MKLRLWGCWSCHLVSCEAGPGSWDLDSRLCPLPSCFSLFDGPHQELPLTVPCPVPKKKDRCYPGGRGCTVDRKAHTEDGHPGKDNIRPQNRKAPVVSAAWIGIWEGAETWSWGGCHHLLRQQRPKQTLPAITAEPWASGPSGSDSLGVSLSQRSNLPAFSGVTGFESW